MANEMHTCSTCHLSSWVFSGQYLQNIFIKFVQSDAQAKFLASTKTMYLSLSVTCLKYIITIVINNSNL